MRTSLASVGPGGRGERSRSHVLLQSGPEEVPKTCQFCLLTFWQLPVQLAGNIVKQCILVCL